MALMCGFTMRQLCRLQASQAVSAAGWLRGGRPGASAALVAAHLPPQQQQLQHVQQRALTVSRPLRSELEHDHVKHWNAERLLSVGMLALVPAAFIFPYPALDYSLALAVVTHSHWGLETIIADYLRPKRVGHVISKVAPFLHYFLSAFMLGGLFYFNYTDVGLVQAIRMLWRA